MKEMQIRRDSWHYKLADKFGGLNSYKHNDFCSYSRRVFLGMLGLVALVALAVAAGYLVASGGFFIYLRVTLGHWPKEGWYAIGVFFDGLILAVAAILGLIALAGYAFEQNNKRKRMARYEQEIADESYFKEHGVYPVREVQTNFAKEAYKAFKEKTCYRLNVN